jgi:hypothetical protein
MRTLIVIVSYQSGGLVVETLRSLANEVAPVDARVEVVDNDSPDGSASLIEDEIAKQRWDWVRLRRMPKNGGFSYGNNAPISEALCAPEPPDYVLLLNPDTVVRPGAIAKLIAHLEAHPEVGIAGSRLEDPDGTPQRSAFRFPTVWSELNDGLRLGPVSKLLAGKVVAPPPRDEVHDTDWVAGASMLIRREVFEQIGLLDENYFLYYEEVDFCLRARRAGWRCDYVPDSRVVHFVGQSTGVTDTKRTPTRRPRYWFESRRRYYAKNHNLAYALLADLAFGVGFAAFRVRRRVQNKPDTDPPKMLSDFVRYSLAGWREPK